MKLIPIKVIPHDTYHTLYEDNRYDAMLSENLKYFIAQDSDGNPITVEQCEFNKFDIKII